MQIGFEEDSMFYKGPSVEVLLSTNDKHTYKLSIDGRFDYITLIHNKKLKFNLEPSSSVISIIRDDKQIQRITIDAKGTQKYYLEVIENTSAGFEIKQIEKQEEPKVKEAVVVKEVAQETQPVTQEKITVYKEIQQAKETGVKPEVKKEASTVVEKQADGETSFSYSRENGE
ncbi:hypothetical protein SMGD1_2429 [Sulfurimonas gotlandica GD1]|jgi:hypothetical protein|uniref:Uncharacterized protein n=2 Tax=Sulfurimonas TaxID=202746 RepID=H1FZ68_SULGG|nr:hypothetical protein SMGD1_2429 [Sulfurimonas gotlandica GD1]